MKKLSKSWTFSLEKEENISSSFLGNKIKSLSPDNFLVAAAAEKGNKLKLSVSLPIHWTQIKKFLLFSDAIFKNVRPARNFKI